MTRTSGLTITIALVLALASAPVVAQTAPGTAPPAEPPSTNAMVNLIRLLVQQGTITRENGDQLLRQAEAEAGQARAAAGGLTPPPAGAVRVPYVPETVRKQIRDEIKGEVMKEAQAEGWAAPNQRAPEWVNGLHPNADFRFRGEWDSFSRDNATDIVDYSAINNTVGGFDFLNNFNNIPIINTTEDRHRLRIRARVGFDFDLGRDSMIGVKLATGDDNGPISTNQVLGGGLSKKNIWLDQGYLKLAPYKWVTALAGRFPNPFFSTDLVYDRDLNFDGALLDVHPFNGNTAVALRGGAFPLKFGSDNFSSLTASTQNYRSPTHWLFGGQLEASQKLGAVKFTAGGAFYDFRNIQGQLSAPCLFNGQSRSILANDPVECSTDGTRAFFPRKGNTLFFLRNIVVEAPDTLPASNRQLFGLTYKYQLLDLNAAIDFPLASIPMRLQGNYVRNLAYDRKDECRYGADLGIPVTNVIVNNGNTNPCSVDDPAKVDSGNQGFLVRLLAGNRNPRKWGQWNLMGEYRYLQTDAVPDAFTDSDFHLGGTNAKGYSVSGTIGLMRGVNLTARWMSANEITGRPLGIDVFQLDLNGEF